MFLLGVVFYQQIKDSAWLRRTAMGAAHCRWARFCVEQVDRLGPRSSCVVFDHPLSCFANWLFKIVRWDPNREDDVFFSQSVSLYASYYHLQILIHRPFIPTPRNPSPLSFPSLAICANAARSCSHVVDMHRKRGLRALSHAQVSVFVPDKRIFDSFGST